MQAVECKLGKKLQSRCRKIQSLEKEVSFFPFTLYETKHISVRCSQGEKSGQP